MKNTRIRVTVWNEGRHEKSHPAVQKLYPDGLHGALAGHLGQCPGLTVRTALLDQPEHGLSEQVLAQLVTPVPQSITSRVPESVSTLTQEVLPP